MELFIANYYQIGQNKQGGSLMKQINKKQLFLFLLCFLVGFNFASAQSNEDCMMCHEDHELTMEKKWQNVICICSNIGNQ